MTTTQSKRDLALRIAAELAEERVIALGDVEDAADVIEVTLDKVEAPRE